MYLRTLALKATSLSWKISALVQLTKKAFIAFGILQNIPDSTVRTRARGTVKRVTVRVDRGGTCKEKDRSRVEASTLPLRMLLRKRRSCWTLRCDSDASPKWSSRL